MENRRTHVVKDTFPKKIDDYNEDEGYTFLSIGGKLPRISAHPDGDLEAEDFGDSSTIAPEVAKPKEASPAAGKAVDSSTKEDDSFHSKGDELTEKEFYSHLNAVGPYDIEIKPPKCLRYPLIPLTLDFLELLKESKPVAYEKYFLGPAKFALQQINMKENWNYEFDGIVKFVNTPLQHVYVTFAGKEEMQSGGTYDKATFQAKVYTPYGYNNFKYELLEWKRKPDPPAPSLI